jgi:uncharacterized protein (TIGR02147 family)
MEAELNPRAQLEAEYLKRRAKNQSYSLRAFAKLLDLPSGRVSQLLSEKRRFTPRVGEQIADRLQYDPRQKDRLLRAIAATRGKTGAPRLARPRATYRSLDMNQFRLIAEPIHFSILSLLETTGFDGQPSTVAARLGVSAVEARAAIRRLEEAGLVRREEDGRVELSGAPGLATSHDVPSAALRRAHRKVLEETIAALEAVPVEERDVTSVTLAIDPGRLPEAKRRLKELRRELGAYLEGGDRREVYRLNIQLVPVTRGRRT